MTYTYYIRKNKLKDSKETYRSYCDKYLSDLESWKCMKEGMKQQYIDVNYKFRFINSAWI